MTAPTVNVVCDLFDGSGNPVTHGTAWFAPSVTLTDAADGMYIPQAPVPAEFRSRVSPSVGLLPTDDPSVLPPGWAWGVQFAYIAGNPSPYNFFLPAGPATFTAAAGTPCVLGWGTTTALTSLPNGSGVQLSGGSVPSAFSTASTYYVVGTSGTTVSLATSRGGSAIASASAGSGQLTVVQYNLSALSPVGTAVTMVSYAQVPAGDLGGTSQDPYLRSIQGTTVAAPTGISTEYLNAQGNWTTPAGGGVGGSVSSVFGRTSAVVAQSGDYSVGQVTGAAPLASPALTGTPTAPTASALTDDTQVATTAYADAAVAVETGRAEAAEALKAPLASPALTGSPTAPTQTTGDNSTKIATDAFVTTAVAAETSRAETAEALLAPKASPALTGTPTAPTASPLTDSTQLATTAYADTAVAVETSRAETAEALALPLAGGTMSGWLAPAVAALTFGSSIAVNAALGNVFTVTLTASTGTIANPSNPVDGQVIRIRIAQDVTGGRTVSWGTAFNFGSGSAPVLSTAGSAIDVVSFEYEAANSYWRFLGATTSLNSPLAITSGGTGQATRQAAINALTGTQGAGEYLRSDGTNAALSAIQAADLPTGTTGAQGALQLDGTAADITGDATAPGAGAVGKAADSGHAHPRFSWTPPDIGLLAWAYDPVIATSSTAMATAGQLQVVKLILPSAKSITSIILNMNTAGSGLTSGQCFAALYQGQAGSLLGTTADQAASWAGATGQKTMAISGGPVAAAAGVLVAAFWYNGTTGPTFSRGAFTNIINGTLSAANSRFGIANTGQTTTAPGTIGTIAASALSFWAGLS